MKPIFHILLLFVCPYTTYSADITAIRNGNWNVATTWDLGRAPADNDGVIIPSGRQVDFTGSPYPKNSPSVRPTLQIKIYGILDFSNSGNDKLYLDAGSSINIYTNGKIQTTGSSSEIIAIYNGTTDNTVWTGTPATVNGPANATATTSGFSNGTLPVKLESFTIQKERDAYAKLAWVTSSEVNSSHFEVQYYNGSNSSWQTVGNVMAAYTSTASIKYHYLVTLVGGSNMFRLKAVDKDDKFVFSPIVSINYREELSTKAYYDFRSNTIIISGSSGKPIEMALFDLTGKLVVAKKNAAPIIYMRKVNSGFYIIKLISNHHQSVQKIFIP